MTPPLGSARAGLVSQIGDAIPDSVVSRGSDNGTYTDATGKAGVEISTSVDWPDIGARLSENISGATKAYIFSSDGSSKLAEVDITDVSAGGAFTFDLIDGLTSGNNYIVTVDAGGSDYDIGLDDDPSFPYSSSDENISIVGGTFDLGSSGNAHNILEVGDVGF